MIIHHYCSIICYFLHPLLLDKFTVQQLQLGLLRKGLLYTIPKIFHCYNNTTTTQKTNADSDPTKPNNE